MADGLILLPRRQVALVVLRTAAAGVQQELRERDIGIPAVIPFLVVHKAPEPHERLLHFLVAVEPFLFARADIRYPAIGQLLCRVV